MPPPPPRPKTAVFNMWRLVNVLGLLRGTANMTRRPLDCSVGDSGLRAPHAYGHGLETSSAPDSHCALTARWPPGCARRCVNAAPWCPWPAITARRIRRRKPEEGSSGNRGHPPQGPVISSSEAMPVSILAPQSALQSLLATPEEAPQTERGPGRTMRGQERRTQGSYGWAFSNKWL